MASGNDKTRRPTLLIVMLVIIVLAIVAFLTLRPGGSGTSTQTNQATPKAIGNGASQCGTRARRAQ